MMPSAMTRRPNARQRAAPAAGKRRAPWCRLSRYSQMREEPASAVPSSSTRAGTLPSGLTAARAASPGLRVTRSMRPSSPVSMAVTATLRTNGEVGE